MAAIAVMASERTNRVRMVRNMAYLLHLAARFWAPGPHLERTPLAITRLIHGEQLSHRPSHTEHVTRRTPRAMTRSIARHNADRQPEQRGVPDGTPLRSLD